MGSLKKLKSKIFVFFPDTSCVRDVSDTANPTLYPLVKLSGGLINAMVWSSPASVIVIVSGINFLDLKLVSLNLNELSSILTTK